LPQIDQAKNSVRTSASQLALLLGERDATQFTLPDLLVPLDAKNLLDPAKTAREPLPELKHAQGMRDQFEEKRSSAMAKYYPSLDFVGTWNRQSFVKSDLLSQDATAWALGLELKIPITAPLASLWERRQLASEAAQLESAQAQVIDARSLSEVTTREALKLAQSNLEAYREAYRIAGQSLAEARRTYRLATIDYVQFLTTEAAFFQTEVSYEQSKFDLINAAAQYCVAAGIPLKQLYQILGVKKS
jgi:outer membrane protein TolC